MNKRILKVGIAGYGSVGKIRHKWCSQHPNMKVVAVCDQGFSDQSTLRDGVLYLNNHHQLIEEQLDVLFVCVPNYIAPELTIAGLEKGFHVFCEKPPGRNLQDITSVIECEKRHSVVQ